MPAIPPKKYQFKKGQSGNPLGGQKHNPELKAIKRITNEHVAQIGSLVLDGNISALQAIAKDPDAPAIKVLIASVVVKAMQKGDAHALNIILDRIAGKIKDRVEVTGTAAPQVVVNLPSNGRESED